METPGEQCLQQHLQGAAGSSAASRSSNHPSEPKDSLQVDSNAGAAPMSRSGAAKRKQLHGGKCTKVVVKVVKQRECAVRAASASASGS
jgi:hypothetical protein